MNATQDAKQRNFVMDRQCLLHPFGRPFPIEAFPSSPPSSLSCEFIYLKNGEKFYKRKTNVEDSIAQLRKARVSSARLPPCASYLSCLCGCPQSYKLLENSTAFNTHIFCNRRRPELRLNWTHNDWRCGKGPWISFLKPRMNRDSSKDGQCGGQGAASIGLAPAIVPFFVMFFSFMSIHRLSW